jgi:hypothetical protein
MKEEIKLPKRVCRECGCSMKVKLIRKATMAVQALYRFTCNCGFEETSTKDVNGTFNIIGSRDVLEVIKSKKEAAKRAYWGEDV